jgi:hypothetical protein
MPQPGQSVCRRYYRAAIPPTVSQSVSSHLHLLLLLFFFHVIPEGDPLLLLLLPLLFLFVIPEGDLLLLLLLLLLVLRRHPNLYFRATRVSLPPKTKPPPNCI